MAFDAAASAVQAPAAGPSPAAAKPAGRKGDASDPFSALLAMLDNANAPAADAKAQPAATVQDDKSASTSEKPGAPVAAAEDAPAPKAEEAPAADPSTLVAAMMVPAAAPAVVAPQTGPVETPSAPSVAPTSPPVAVVDAPVEGEAKAVDLPKSDFKLDTQAATPVQTVDNGAPAEPAPPAIAPEVKPVETASAANAATPLEAAAPKDEPKPHAEPVKEPVVNAAARHAEARSGDPADSRGQGDKGSRSDADAAQLAQARTTAAPDSAAPIVSDAVEAAPVAPAPTAPPPAAPAAAAPIIQAQAAPLPVRGSPETVAHLAAQMIQRLDGQTTRFDLSLNPQSLGRVDVRIEIGAKGALKARLAFDDAASAHELGGRQAELRAALQSAGFDVPEGAITYDVASGGGSGAGADSPFAERQDSGRAAPAFTDLADTADADPAAIVKSYFNAAGSSGVDIRV